VGVAEISYLRLAANCRRFWAQLTEVVVALLAERELLGQTST
jgi:hypothetical protein